MTQGYFGWLKRAPWRDPGFSSMILSLVLFGFVGGITGVTFGTEQINIIAHNTLRVPGHFHATVVAGTAMAFMGVTYYVIPLIFRKQLRFYALARWQPWVFSVGMLTFSMAMTFAGSFGVPRRHWDINFPGAPFQFEFSPTVDLAIAVMAIGGLIAAVGGGMYILVTVSSVFFGRALPEGELGAAAAHVPPGVAHPVSLPAEQPELPSFGRVLGHTPGTMILVAIFLAAFIAYYFVNWKLLSALWTIG
jgi:cytochrome c oxidase subunit 1